MNKIKLLGSLIFLLIGVSITYAQQIIILHIPQALEIDAGDIVTIDQFDQVTLGGNPTAQFGISPYQYSWTPITGLSDPLIANPVASPGDTTIYNLEVIDANGCIITDEVTVNVITVGINDIYSNNDISIYPNPGDGKLNIDFHRFSGNLEISCVNVLGKIIVADEIFVEKGSTYFLDISSQPAGNYFINLKGDYFNITRSIIKN